MDDKFGISKVVEKYYTNKIKEFGTTPQGVDWSNAESQQLRYEKIFELIKDDSNYTIADYGCGYGYLSRFLVNKNINAKYTGYDLSAEMIKAAKSLNEDLESVFIKSDCFTKIYDYVVSSGIFNVKFDFKEDKWQEMIEEKIQLFNEYSEKGFAFNCLSLYSDVEKRRDDLFYADPLYFFDLCKKKYSKNVALLHDYDLYEFTIIVRK